MAKEAKMPGIRFYLSELDLMESVLLPEEICYVIQALKNYVRNGDKDPMLNDRSYACFMFLKERVDADMRAYRETCERNRANAEKRWEKSHGERECEV